LILKGKPRMIFPNLELSCPLTSSILVSSSAILRVMISSVSAVGLGVTRL
jgi:hypothetical protein